MVSFGSLKQLSHVFKICIDFLPALFAGDGSGNHRSGDEPG